MNKAFQNNFAFYLQVQVLIILKSKESTMCLAGALKVMRRVFYKIFRLILCLFLYFSLVLFLYQECKNDKISCLLYDKINIKLFFSFNQSINYETSRIKNTIAWPCPAVWYLFHKNVTIRRRHIVKSHS